jgi:UDP-glucose 4-epimerase
MLMDTVLVTGAAGFLGSHIAEYLVRRGHHVVTVDDLSGGYRRNIPGGADFYQASTCDSVAIERLFDQYCFRYVFHCAAYAAEGLSHHIRCFNYYNNILGSIPLINASIAHGIECFVFTSSIAVYGSGALPFTENSIPRPLDPYGIGKLAVEYDLQAASRYFGLQYIIFRPHNVYGERQNLSDPFRNVLGIFMRQVLEGKSCTIYGDGSQRRAFSCVDDVAPVIARSVEAPAARNRIFNIGADDVFPVMEIAGLVQRALGRETGIVFLPERHEVHTAYCDHRLVREILGYSDRIGIEAGIGRMAGWARTVQRASRTEFPVIEVNAALPLSWKDRHSTA